MKKKLLFSIGILVVILVVFTGMFYRNQSIINNESSNNADIKENINIDQDIIKDENTRWKGVKLTNKNINIPILCYHSIADDEGANNTITLSRQNLENHLKTINDEGYTTLTINELNKYISEDMEVPEKSLVLTFDDGYKNNYTNALPILKKYNMKATFFVIAEYSLIDGDTGMFLNINEIREMQESGMDIQSHTVTHRELATLSYDDQLKEMIESKQKIEGILGNKVISLAYPVGSYNDDTKKALGDAGYNLGLTINRGNINKESDKYELNRICIDYTYGERHIRKLLKKN